MSFKRLNLSIISFLLLCNSYAQTINWQHLGPFTTPKSTAKEGDWCSTGMGWIESLYVSDDLKTLYAGTITSGLFKSTDGGKHWDIIKQNDLQYGVFDIDVKGNHIYTALGLTHYEPKFGNGIIYSKDKGKSWSDKENDASSFVNSPCWGVAALTKKCIIRADENALYRTENKGITWDTVLQSDENMKYIFRQLIKSEHKKKISYASGNVLLRSTDAGLHWVSLHYNLSVNEGTKAVKMRDRGLDSSQIWNSLQVQRIALAEDPNQKDHLLALYSFNHKTLIDESYDGGRSWKNIYQSHRVQRIDINHAEIAIAPGSSSTVLVGGVNAYLSVDGGYSFTQVTFPKYLKENFVHDDIRAVVLKDSNTFYLGTDGGVVASFDRGETWENLNGYGLTAMMIYGLGLTHDGFIVGCQDLGTFLYKDSSWLNLGFMYGDGGDAITVNGSLHTVLGGRYREVSLKPLKPTIYRSPRNRMNPFSSKLYQHPKDSSVFLVSDHLWSLRSGEWKNLTKDIDNHGYKAADLDINALDHNTMHFAFDQPSWGDSSMQKLVKSSNGGKHWVDLTPNLPILQWKYITGISSHPKNADHLLVCLGDLDRNKEIHKVYRSDDGGDSWMNWSDGLPPYPCFKIMHIPSSQSGVLVSNIKGLYYRNENMEEWIFLCQGIPHIAIRDFEIDDTTNSLYIATYGNGVWKTSIPPEWITE